MSCCSYALVPMGDTPSAAAVGKRRAWECIVFSPFILLLCALGRCQHRTKVSGRWGLWGAWVCSGEWEFGRCCVEVMPDVGEKRNPVSPSAEVWLSAVYLSPIIPGVMPSGKMSLPSMKVRLNGQVICVLWGGWKGPQKDVNKRRKISAFTQGFPKLCGSFTQLFSTVDLMVSSYLTTIFMMHIR